MFEWLKLSAAELGREIGEGAIDPVALTQAFLGAIESHGARDRIYTQVTVDRALAEAEAAAERARAGARQSLLDGVPISWKDLFDSAAIPTEAGSALLQGRVPQRDAVVLERATRSGLVCLGKTHMSELAFSGLGYNPMAATPPCVNDQSAVPGGSSSGAAASVAFDLAAIGVGSDTGGSVRIPSAWNDLVGLKTTWGRISTAGTVPLCEKFDTIGPLCRTVEDASLMLSVLDGSNVIDLKGASLKGMRFGVLQTTALDDLREAPETAFMQSLQIVKDAGAELVSFDAPEVAQALSLSGPLFTAEAYGIWSDVIEAKPDLMFHEIRERFRAGAGVSGPEYVNAWTELNGLRKQWSRRVAPFDAVLCPTSPILPPNLERLETDHDYYVSENLLALRNTRIGNLFGLCAISLPTLVPSCGLMFLGKANQEARLLRLAKAAEQAFEAARTAHA